MKITALFILLFSFVAFFHQNASAQMTHKDSIKVHNKIVKHRNDSIREAHKVVIDSVYYDGKYYPVTSTDIYSHDEKVKETELEACSSGSLCKTISVKRKEAEEVRLDLPTNKLSGKITMYKDNAMTLDITSTDFLTGDDFISLKFPNIDDGTYTFKLDRSDQTFIIRLEVITTQFWK